MAAWTPSSAGIIGTDWAQLGFVYTFWLTLTLTHWLLAGVSCGKDELKLTYGPCTSYKFIKCVCRRVLDHYSGLSLFLGS